MSAGVWKIRLASLLPNTAESLSVSSWALTYKRYTLPLAASAAGLDSIVKVYGESCPNTNA